MDRLRLVMLFALRYEKQARDIEELVRLLGTRGVSESEARVSLQAHSFRGGVTKSSTRYCTLTVGSYLW